MYFIFSLIALLCWSGSDLFSKLGTSQKDKNSQWHVIFAVGIIMGIHAIICIIVSSFLPEIPTIINPEYNPLEEGSEQFISNPEWWRSLIYTDFKPIDFIRYLPIGCIYLAAMVVGYVGLRYIELSVSSPICNSSGSLALLICIIFGLTTITLNEASGIVNIIGIVFITIGIILLGIVEYKEDDKVKLARQNNSNFKYRKSIIAILIPVIYLFLDALGTVGDQIVSEFELFDMSEFASNTAFEFTSLLFAILAFIVVTVIKKEKFFNSSLSLLNKKYLVIGGCFETVGQIFYMSVMFSSFKAGMPMIGAYCVISVLWSRIFLKEKLSIKHYITIALTITGIIMLGIAEVI